MESELHQERTWYIPTSKGLPHSHRKTSKLTMELLLDQLLGRGVSKWSPYVTFSVHGPGFYHTIKTPEPRIFNIGRKVFQTQGFILKHPSTAWEIYPIIHGVTSRWNHSQPKHLLKCKLVALLATRLNTALLSLGLQLLQCSQLHQSKGRHKMEC